MVKEARYSVPWLACNLPVCDSFSMLSVSCARLRFVARQLHLTPYSLQYVTHPKTRSCRSRRIALIDAAVAAMPMEPSFRRASTTKLAMPKAGESKSGAPSTDLKAFLFDLDGDQKLDYDEFYTMQPASMRERFSPQTIREWFEEADADGSGHVSLNEFFLWSLRKAGNQFGEYLSPVRQRSLRSPRLASLHLPPQPTADPDLAGIDNALHSFKWARTLSGASSSDMIGTATGASTSPSSTRSARTSASPRSPPASFRRSTGMSRARSPTPSSCSR